MCRNRDPACSRHRTAPQQFTRARPRLWARAAPRRPFTKRLSGWLSYTLSRSTRQAHFLTAAGTDDLANVVSEFDRTHVLNVIIGYNLGRGWRLGSRLVVQTGTPYSKLDGSLPVPPTMRTEPQHSIASTFGSRKDGASARADRSPSSWKGRMSPLESKSVG